MNVPLKLYLMHDFSIFFALMHPFFPQIVSLNIKGGNIKGGIVLLSVKCAHSTKDLNNQRKIWELWWILRKIWELWWILQLINNLTLQSVRLQTTKNT